MRGFLRGVLAPPEFAGDEGKSRRARVLNLFLVREFLSVLIAGSLIVAFSSVELLEAAAVAVVLVAVLFGTRASMRAGRVQLASLAWILTVGLFTTVLAFFAGGLTYFSIILYLSVVVHAWLLFRRTGVMVAAGSSLLCAAMLVALARTGSLPPPRFSGFHSVAWAVAAFVFAWTVLPMILAVREMSNALDVAQRGVAERACAQDALWENEDRFRSTFEQAAVGIAHVRPDGRFLRINQRFSDIVGYSRFELLSLTFQDITYPEDLDADLDLVRQLLAAERANFSVQKRYVRRDGSLVWVNLTVSLLRSQTGEPRYFISVVQDINEQKRAEEALRLSEERFRTIVEEFSDGLCLFDEEGVVLEWNKSIEQITGISRGEAVGLPYCDVVWRNYLPERQTPDRYQYLKASVQETVRTGRLPSLPEEIGIQPLSGGRRTVQQNVFRIRTSRGNRIGTVVRDITQRQQTEAALKLDESRLEGLLRLTQLSHEPVQDIANYAMEEAVRLTQSRIGYVAFANEDESVLTMHAWSQQAMRECAIDNKPIHYPVEATGLWGEAVRQRRPIVTNDYTAAGPWKKGTPEGHIALVRHLNVPIFEGNRIVAVAGVGNKSFDYDESDIRQMNLLMTEMWRIVQRKRNEEKLRESEERFRIAFDTTPEPMAISRLSDGVYLTVNLAFAKATGWAPGSVLGRSSSEIGIWAHDEDRNRIVIELRDRGVVSNLEANFRVRDGSVRPTLLSARTFPIGGVPHVVWVMRDMTELRQVEAERTRLAEQLRQAQKLESIGRLAGGVAHDFNNILTAIFGHAEMALMELEPGHRLRTNLEEILKSGERAKGLTRQLLAFARRQAIEPRVLNLNELMEGLGKMLRRLIGEHIELVMQSAPDLGLIKADPGQIEQVLLNLVVNARDAMPKGGTITIRTANVTAGEAEAHRSLDLMPGEYVGFSVDDTGVGMTDEVKKHVFEPFFTTKEPGKGTGLGLATCFGIIGQSNGHVRFESEVDRGTTFEMLLPRVWKADVPTPRSEFLAGLPRGSEMVLVAEDEAPLRHLMGRMLTAQGYVVVEAADGHEALLLAEKGGAGIRLIVTDVVMPRLNGPDWVKRLDEIHPGSKVLFVSGHLDESLAGGVESRPGSHLLQKPFTPSEFLRKVREVLDAQSR